MPDEQRNREVDGVDRHRAVTHVDGVADGGLDGVDRLDRRAVRQPVERQDAERAADRLLPASLEGGDESIPGRGVSSQHSHVPDGEVGDRDDRRRSGRQRELQGLLSLQERLREVLPSE